MISFSVKLPTSQHLNSYFWRPIIITLVSCTLLHGCYTPVSYDTIYPENNANTWQDVVENSTLLHIDANTNASTGWLKDLFLAELLLNVPATLQSNKQLKQDILQITVANLDTNINYGAALPNLTATASTNDAPNQYTENLQFGLSGTLFDWGTARSANKYNSATEVSLIYNYFDSVNSVTANLAKTTLDWYLVELQTQLAQLALNSAQDVLSLSIQQYEMGVINNNQLTSARELYHRANDSKVQLDIMLRNITTNLKKIVGIYQPIEFKQQYPMLALNLDFAESLLQVAIPTFKWQWSIKDIVALHPSIQKAASAVDQSNYLAAATVKSLFPRINFSATSSSANFAELDFSQSVAVSAVANLFSWGSKIKEYEKSKINVDIAIERYAQTIVNIFSDIDKFAYLDEKYSKKLTLQKKQNINAQQDFAIAKQEYFAGITNLSSYKQAETNYYTYLQQLLTALGNWQKNRIDLYISLGLQPFSEKNTFNKSLTNRGNEQ